MPLACRRQPHKITTQAMKSKINWSFEGQSVFHISTDESFAGDINKMAKLLKIPADTKYIIHNGNDQSTTTDATDSISATPSPKLTAVSKRAKTTEDGETPTKLCDVYGNVDGSDDSDPGVSSSDNSVADSSASDWYDDQRV